MIFVDEPRWRHGQMKMCHMVTDSQDLDPLHQMADAIGVPRKHFQDAEKAKYPHYDISVSKRYLALKRGAIEITSKNLIRVLRREPMVQEIDANYMTQKFREQNLNRFEWMFPNVYVGDSNRYEMDIMGVRRSGYVDEIEIKVSIPDFKADFNKTVPELIAGPLQSHQTWRPTAPKPKHLSLREGNLITNRFWFLVPERLHQRLLEQLLVPSYAGLMVCGKSGWIREITRAPILHKRKIEENELLRISKNIMHRYWKASK